GPGRTARTDADSARESSQASSGSGPAGKALASWQPFRVFLPAACCESATPILMAGPKKAKGFARRFPLSLQGRPTLPGSQAYSVPGVPPQPLGSGRLPARVVIGILEVGRRKRSVRLELEPIPDRLDLPPALGLRAGVLAFSVERRPP